ncbi:MAG: homoserine dehydrogenase [Lachnospiraceae bacterium]|nr:homoserine dehydrogenase [Lachnospiraceae bacterium]
MAEVAVLGYGTVGSGVVEVIENNRDVISKRCEGLHVKYILDLRDFPGDPYEDRVVHDFDSIINDPEVKIVCETMGGATFAYNYTKACLEAGKSVCTSNKELVEKYGAELSRIAAGHSCSYLFEASVGGGIPLIRTINEALTAEKIERIYGILNGTTNYILYRMETAGLDFKAALCEAQEFGYAEKDPTADIEGHDPCRKIAILASLVTGKKVDYTKILMEGIKDLSIKDIEYAKAAGMCIKLIAMSEFKNGGCYCMVSPRLIAASNPLSIVKDVFNAVLIHSDMLDDSMYYGRGAGKLATASAVVGDAVECANNIGKTVFCGWSEEEAQLADIDDLEQSYFVRVKDEAAGAFKAAVKTKDCVLEGIAEGEKGYFTESMTEGGFKKAIADLDGVIGYIRM